VASEALANRNTLANRKMNRRMQTSLFVVFRRFWETKDNYNYQMMDLNKPDKCIPRWSTRLKTASHSSSLLARLDVS